MTSAKVNPSYPLLPTVWIVVALTRRSAASSWWKRRTPITAGSVLAGSATAPLRTALSTMINVPRR